MADIDKVLAYARQELSGLIATSSPTTKTICAVLGVSYVVNFIAPWVADYFALVPERTIPCVWNIVRPFREIGFSLQHHRRRHHVHRLVQSGKKKTRQKCVVCLNFEIDAENWRTERV